MAHARQFFSLKRMQRERSGDIGGRRRGVQKDEGGERGGQDGVTSALNVKLLQLERKARAPPCPCAAARRYHRTASTWFCATPVPLLNIPPKLH